MKKHIGLLLLIVSSLSMKAQLAEGKKNIEQLCGCFDVQFKYAETFAFIRDYQFHDREEMRATELALPIEQGDKKVVIQHLLVMKDTMVIKHWREDWVYEQPYLWVYQGDKKWIKKELKPEQYQGKWTQTVWEVDDAPRYQGMSDWVHTDGKTFWLNTTNAPLPRREYSTRSDYNILRRGNRVVVTGNGYVHEQDNDKVLLKNGTESVIAQEKGFNIYTKLADEKCAAATAWWKDNAAFWGRVRDAWESTLKENSTVNLQAKVDSKSLHQYLEELEQQFRKKQLSPEELTGKTKAVLQKFVRTASDMASLNQ